MIGFLRFIGIVNAAIWLGATFFYLFEVQASLFLPDMEPLLGAGNSAFFPYVSTAMALTVLAACFHLQGLCAAVAWVQALAEWLYLGRPARKFSFSLLAGLLALACVGGGWLQPRLRQLHTAHYRAAQSAERVAAGRSFHTWQTVSLTLQIVTIGGLAIYLWRVTHPTDTPRFVSSVKFRG